MNIDVTLFIEVIRRKAYNLVKLLPRLNKNILCSFAEQGERGDLIPTLARQLCVR